MSQLHVVYAKALTRPLTPFLKHKIFYTPTASTIVVFLPKVDGAVHGDSLQHADRFNSSQAVVNPDTRVACLSIIARSSSERLR